MKVKWEICPSCSEMLQEMTREVLLIAIWTDPIDPEECVFCQAQNVYEGPTEW